MIFFYLVLGLLAGILSGVVGIGGIVLFPALVFFFHMSQHKALGTSLTALLAPVGILAFWQYYNAGNVDVTAGVLVAIAFAVGGYFGGVWVQQIHEAMLCRIFGILLVLVGVHLLFKA